jgi:K+-transporting ATPase KdpF subunit
MCAAAKSCNEELAMSVETVLGLAASALLLVYLTYALLRPEKF